jgi:hypothetical protein
MRIGTCSLCGGPVVTVDGADHSTPHCDRCGAVAKWPATPVIPMERPQWGTRQGTQVSTIDDNIGDPPYDGRWNPVND